MCRLALCPAPEQTFRIAAFLPACLPHSHGRVGGKPAGGRGWGQHLPASRSRRLPSELEVTKGRDMQKKLLTDRVLITHNFHTPVLSNPNGGPKGSSGKFLF